MAIRGAPKDSRERGFTLVEILIAVVILGIVMAPLCMALVQALQVVPQSNARTSAATDADRLLTTFTRDIANANSQWTNASGKVRNWAASGVWDGTTSGNVACPSNGSSPIVEPVWSDLAPAGVAKQSAQYVVKAILAGTTVGSVEVHRLTFVNGTQTNDEKYLSGYCKLGQSFATTSVSFPNGVEDVQVTLNLTDQNGAPLSTVVLDGKVRAT